MSSLLQRVRECPSNTALLPALLWLLLSQQQLPSSSLDKETSAAVLALICSGLKQAGEGSVNLLTALDCVSLALALPEVQTAADEEWVAAVVPRVTALLDEGDQPYTLVSTLYVQYMYNVCVPLSRPNCSRTFHS